MQIARATVVGCAAASLVVGAVTTGCSSEKGSSPSGSVSTTAITSGAPLQDYTALLINATDIGADYTAPQPATQNPNGAAGVQQLFANADSSRRIGDAILLALNPDLAAAGVAKTKTNYASKVSGDWAPVDVGTNGTIISATSADNTQAITVLLFSEGKALVSLEFDSAPGDPIDAGFATDVGRKQDAAIKANLPN